MARPKKEKTVMIRVRISDSKRLKKKAKIAKVSIPDYIHKTKWN